ncbi:DUF981 domain-containing protein [Nocardioides antri]|uniref:DUF981 domain-containing protein n=1 Tax=Nocardioides antri TaxID=2607659 RepID=A0A5B1M2I6_9ACTN|nr:DUF981 domain-containing protein [Nocardioides antri]KAA1426618.1 DUF981 domain-containing protein [Nocardioides antri]
MVVYNELVAVTAGAGLLGFAAFLADLIRDRRINSEGWAAFFAITGALLLVTGLHTTLTWPFGGGGFEYANIAFGQPAAGFGALLLFAAVYLWRHRALFAGDVGPAKEAALAAMRPAGIFVGALGLGMAVLAVTFVRFQLGAAPPEEPISGRFGHLPIIEAMFLGGLWGIVALGALIFATALWTDRLGLLRWATRAWLVGGVVFLLFGAMNFYTHIGMYDNIANGTMHKW